MKKSQVMTKAKTLTDKQDKFCRLYIELGHMSDAYRGAYNTKSMKDSTVNNEASKLLARPHIAARVADLRSEHAEAHRVTVESILEELELARIHAMKDDKGASAAVSAAMGKARLCGLIVEKQEDVTPKRDRAEIDARINQILADKGSRGASKPVGREGDDRRKAKDIPTVSGHGTA